MLAVDCSMYSCQSQFCSILMYCALLPVWVLGAAGLRQLLEATMESFGGNIVGRLKLSSGSDYGLQHFCSFCRRQSTAGVHGGEELKESRCSNTLSCQVEAPSGVRPEAAKNGGIHEPRSPH